MIEDLIFSHLFFIVILNKEENASLRAKLVALEEDLRKSKQETSDHQNLCRQLEKVHQRVALHGEICINIWSAEICCLN